jgi:hypothetical protein
MNERIEELMFEAGRFADENTGSSDRSGMWVYQYSEKFAELIVADCIALADKYAAGGAGSEFDVGYISCAETLSQEMKQQFGVKE